MSAEISSSLTPHVNPFDSTGYELADIYAHCIPTIEIEHYNTHRGIAFVANGSITVSSGADGYIQLDTDGKAVHLRRSLLNIGTSDFIYTVYEGATVTTPGTAISAFNLNRVSSNTSTVQAYTGSTGVSGGLQLTNLYLPGSKSVNTSDISGFEIIYKQNTTYVAKVHNNGSTSNTLYFQLFWYEL